MLKREKHHRNNQIFFSIPGAFAASRRNSASSSSASSTEKSKHGLMNLEDEIDTSIDPGGSGADGIDAKSKMLIKKGKVAVKANRQVHKASVAIKRMRRR